jgi:hypothetical protein
MNHRCANIAAQIDVAAVLVFLTGRAIDCSAIATTSRSRPVRGETCSLFLRFAVVGVDAIAGWQIDVAIGQSRQATDLGPMKTWEDDAPGRDLPAVGGHVGGTIPAGQGHRVPGHARSGREAEIGSLIEAGRLHACRAA